LNPRGKELQIPEHPSDHSAFLPPINSKQRNPHVSHVVGQPQSAEAAVSGIDRGGVFRQPPRRPSLAPLVASNAGQSLDPHGESDVAGATCHVLATLYGVAHPNHVHLRRVQREPVVRRPEPVNRAVDRDDSCATPHYLVRGNVSQTRTGPDNRNSLSLLEHRSPRLGASRLLASRRLLYAARLAWPPDRAFG